MVEHCGNCRYAQPNSVEAVACHRYPPTITKAEGPTVTSYFPLVTLTAWCGEWRRAPTNGKGHEKMDKREKEIRTSLLRKTGKR